MHATNRTYLSAASTYAIPMAAALALSWFAGSCAAPDHVDAELHAQTNQLCASRWVLRQIDGASATNFEGMEIDLHFEAEGRFHGYSGVNQYAGPWKTKRPEELRIGTIGTTRRLGPTAAMQQEKLYLDRLARTESYALERDVLILMDAAGTPSLTFLAHVRRER